MKKPDRKNASHEKLRRNELSDKQEAERREELVQHEANYDPKEEDADLKVARKHKS